MATPLINETVGAGRGLDAEELSFVTLTWFFLELGAESVDFGDLRRGNGIGLGEEVTWTWFEFDAEDVRRETEELDENTMKEITKETMKWTWFLLELEAEGWIWLELENVTLDRLDLISRNLTILSWLELDRLETWELDLDIEILTWLETRNLSKNRNEKFEEIAWVYENSLMLQ